MSSNLLEEARSALHKIAIGKGVASIKKDGRQVEYSAVNVGELRTYISSLEAQAGTNAVRRRARSFC
jgi:hypothetical protein